MAKKIGKREETLFVAMHDLVFVDGAYLEKYIFLKEDGTSSSKPCYISKHMKMLENEGYIKSFPLAKDEITVEISLFIRLIRKAFKRLKRLLVKLIGILVGRSVLRHIFIIR